MEKASGVFYLEGGLPFSRETSRLSFSDFFFPFPLKNEYHICAGRIRVAACRSDSEGMKQSEDEPAAIGAIHFKGERKKKSENLKRASREGRKLSHK